MLKYARSSSSPQLRDLIRKAGFDGVGYTNRHEGFGRSFIAFDADQIRIESVLRGPAVRALAFEGGIPSKEDWSPWIDTSIEKVHPGNDDPDVANEADEGLLHRKLRPRG